MQGGAIDARSTDYVTISSSSFISCKSHSKSGSSGGGGVDLWYIKIHPSIRFCWFLYCSSGNDGGGAAICNSSVTTNQMVCDDCRFIKCSVPKDPNHSLSPVAGGIIIWHNTQPAKSSNLLLKLNEAAFGGALGTHSTFYSLTLIIISFCFFCTNVGVHGNDVYISSVPSQPPFLHCFSTSASGRIGYYNEHGYDSTDCDWLPLAYSHNWTC